jgi:hypothetical protein
MAGSIIKTNKTHFTGDAMPNLKLAFLGLTLAVALGLAACDQAAIDQLEEGVATEQDVRAKFGEPERVYDEADGSRTLEYNRQPAGHRNYMITVGTDGKMSALRQVLTAQNFAKVQPGMEPEPLRRLLGKPAKIITYELKRETYWNWRYLDNTQSMIFSAVFSPEMRVLRTENGIDPESESNRR